VPKTLGRMVSRMSEQTPPNLPDLATIQKWQKAFRDMGAEWVFEGGEFCALYTLSGKVADYYFNSEIISNNYQVLTAVCQELYLPELQRRSISIERILSYPPYGVAFANALARELGVQSSFIHSLESPNLLPDVPRGARVLVVADDIFSGASVRKVFQAAQSRECEIAPLVFSFGNFSGRSSLHGKEIFSVITRQVELFDISDSPLVARGVRAINAREHWDEYFAPNRSFKLEDVLRKTN
jgi:orotate phosphoribosyltransferase